MMLGTTLKNFKLRDMVSLSLAEACCMGFLFPLGRVLTLLRTPYPYLDFPMSSLGLLERMQDRKVRGAREEGLFLGAKVLGFSI